MDNTLCKQPYTYLILLISYHPNFSDRPITTGFCENQFILWPKTWDPYEKIAICVPASSIESKHSAIDVFLTIRYSSQWNGSKNASFKCVRVFVYNDSVLWGDFFFDIWGRRELSSPVDEFRLNRSESIVFANIPLVVVPGMEPQAFWQSGRRIEKAAVVSGRGYRYNIIGLISPIFFSINPIKIDRG